jgi:hypothetical protein
MLTIALALPLTVAGQQAAPPAPPDRAAIIEFK